MYIGYVKYSGFGGGDMETLAVEMMKWISGMIGLFVVGEIGWSIIISLTR